MAFKPSTSNRPSTSKSTKVTSTTTRMCTSWISYCDYECLCNYHIETAVYSGPKTSGGKIGSMHEFDCKPTYHMVPSSRRWQAIQYQKQVSKSKVCQYTVCFVCYMFTCNLFISILVWKGPSVPIESVSGRCLPVTIYSIAIGMFCKN